MMRWALVLFALSASPAWAHDPSGIWGSAPAWTYDPWLVAPLYAIGIAFFIGTRKLWRSAGFGKGLHVPQVIAFWTGWLILALALVSPLHWLGERLFTAHMVEHEILIIMAAPLLAFARPSGALLWSLPRRWRPVVGAFWNSGPILAIWRFIGNPITATLLQGAIFWAWHAPRLYEWALENEAVHRLEHLSFFFSAYLFWWVLFHGRGPGRGERVRDGIAIGCLFVTVLHSSLLGALLTISTRLWYPQQVQFAAEFGLTPLADQQLAGVIMWVPMGAVYTGLALYFAQRLLEQASRTVPDRRVL